MTRRQGALVALAALIAASAWYSLRHVTLDSDYSAFLPAGTSDTQRALMRELREGLGSRVVLIALGGAPQPELAQASRKLVAALEQSPAFRYANNGSGNLGQRELALIGEHRYALSDRLDAPDPFSRDALRAALEERLASLSTSAGVLDKLLLASDPTAETRRVLARMSPMRSPPRIDGVWFDPEGKRALLVAQTRAFGSDLEGQAGAVAALEQAFAASRTSGAMTLEYSSPGTMAVRSRALIAGDARTLSLVSMAGVLAILAWAYRSPAVVALCVLPALCGLLAGVLIVDAGFGSIHGITLAFGATLLGEAVDYPTYLLTQMREGASAHEVTARIGRLLGLAVLTTVCGAFALLFSGFPGLAQLGAMTVTGVLVAGAATLWVLPHVVPAGWRPPPPPRWSWLSGSTGRSWRPALRWGLVAVATACVLALAWQRPWWDDDLASMSPLPASAKSSDAQLRSALGAPDVRYVLTVSGESREDALRRSEALRPVLDAAVASRQLGAFDLVSDLVPSEDTQARRRQALPDPQRLRADLESAAAGLPFRPGVFEPFVEGVARARDVAPVTPETFKDSALGFKMDGLLRQDGGRWHVVVPLTEVRDTAGLVRALPADARLIDLRGETTAMMAAYRERGLGFSAIGLVLIYAVLAVGLRSPARAAKVLLPVVLAAIAAAAILVAFLEPLTVFHYVALLLTIGIGVNYALLMASPVARDDPAAMWRTLAVVSGTALVTFGVLAFAHAPVLHAIGVTVTVGVIASLVFAAMLVRPVAEGVA